MGKRTEYMAKYYKEHKQQRDAYHSAWVERNRDKIRAYNNARYHAKKAQKGTEA